MYNIAVFLHRASGPLPSLTNITHIHTHPHTPTQIPSIMTHDAKINALPPGVCVCVMCTYAPRVRRIRHVLRCVVVVFLFVCVGFFVNNIFPAFARCPTLSIRIPGVVCV